MLRDFVVVHWWRSLDAESQTFRSYDRTLSATSLPSLAARWIAVCPAVLRKSKCAPASTRVNIIDRGADKLAATLIGVSAGTQSNWYVKLYSLMYHKQYELLYHQGTVLQAALRALPVCPSVNACRQFWRARTDGQPRIMSALSADIFLITLSS